MRSFHIARSKGIYMGCFRALSVVPAPTPALHAISLEQASVRARGQDLPAGNARGPALLPPRSRGDRSNGGSQKEHTVCGLTRVDYYGCLLRDTQDQVQHEQVGPLV